MLNSGARGVLVLLLLFSTVFFSGFSSWAEKQDFKAGVARIDVTPDEPVFLGGYAARTNVSKGVAQRIFVKALVLQDSAGAKTLFLTADTIGTPRWFNDQLAERINKELKIPRERFLFACSHSHSTPAIKGALDAAYEMSAQAAEAEQRYSMEFLRKCFAAAQAAFTALEPVQLAFGRGEALFAANRRQFGKSGAFIGVNPNGVVDHDVPVLGVQNLDSSIKAIVFGYACHCTTLGPNDELSPDWAGYAQQCLEQAYPGATALFITGCGADANPNPRGKMMHVTQHGLELAGAVAQTLNKAMVPLSGPIQAAFNRVNLPFGPLPQREDFQAKLTNSTPAVVRFAQRFLDMMQRGESLPTSYPCPVQVLRFGDSLTLVAIGGEVVADYSLRLHRELPGEQLWTAGYCNDVFAYVPSVRVLIEGGYEAEGNLIYYGLPTRFAPEVEDILVQKVIGLISQARIPKQL